MKKRVLAFLVACFTFGSSISAMAAEDVQVADEVIVESAETDTYDKVVLPSRNYTGLVLDNQAGRCYLYGNGKFASTYTGLWGDPVYGWWLVVNGEVNFAYTDFYCDPVCGWWKITGGTIDWGYTGWYSSPTIGTWYVVGGQLDVSKGQKVNVATYNDGYSDNTYGVATGVISNQTEAMNFILNALRSHATKMDVTLTNGYTYTDFLDGCLYKLKDAWYYETDCYDYRCFSTWKNWQWLNYVGNNMGRFTIDLVYAEGTPEEQALDAVAAQMKAKTAGMSDYEKVVTIHDYIINVNSYDYTYQSSSPYGALILGKSTCHGYALAFQKLAEACGLTSKYLASVDREHAYNVVLLNGQWYFLDATWDDGQDDWRNSRTYFLKGISGMKAVSYKYTSSFTSGVYSFNVSYSDY